MKRTFGERWKFVEKKIREKFRANFGQENHEKVSEHWCRTREEENQTSKQWRRFRKVSQNCSDARFLARIRVKRGRFVSYSCCREKGKKRGKGPRKKSDCCFYQADWDGIFSKVSVYLPARAEDVSKSLFRKDWDRVLSARFIYCSTRNSKASKRKKWTFSFQALVNFYHAYCEVRLQPKTSSQRMTSNCFLSRQQRPKVKLGDA